MNIFFLSLNPVECAQLYCDQHVIKILLEITQMLYTAWHMSEKPDDWKPPLTLSGTRGYKKAHPNHPMCMWVRSSRKSYMFTVKLGMALALEYNNRFLKCHACTKHIVWLQEHVPPTFDPKKESDGLLRQVRSAAVHAQRTPTTGPDTRIQVVLHDENVCEVFFG